MSCQPSSDGKAVLFNVWGYMHGLSKIQSIWDNLSQQHTSPVDSYGETLVDQAASVSRYNTTYLKIIQGFLGISAMTDITNVIGRKPQFADYAALLIFNTILITIKEDFDRKSGIAKYLSSNGLFPGTRHFSDYIKDEITYLEASPDCSKSKIFEPLHLYVLPFTMIRVKANFCYTLAQTYKDILEPLRNNKYFY